MPLQRARMSPQWKVGDDLLATYTLVGVFLIWFEVRCLRRQIQRHKAIGAKPQAVYGVIRAKLPAVCWLAAT